MDEWTDEVIASRAYRNLGIGIYSIDIVSYAIYLPLLSIAYSLAAEK